MTTATTHGAREHARAQAGTVAEAMPFVPASTYPGDLPDGVSSGDLVWAERVAGGGYAHRRLEPGDTVRFTDVDGDACAHLALFRADCPWERLCVADTVKVLWQAYTGSGQLLLSDQGRVLASVVDDTSGLHDAFCGTPTAAAMQAKHGDGSPQGPSPAGRELLVLAAGKHGLGRRDLPPTISLFKGVRVADDGTTVWMGSAGPGRSVTVTAELPVIMLVANVPHPIDPRPDYRCTALDVVAWCGRATSPSDERWTASPEAERAFANTAEERR